MSVVTVRYSGRACLLGEHCDWAGGSSLTVPLPMGIEFRAEPAREGLTLRSEMDGELFEERWTIEARNHHRGPLRFVSAVINQLLETGIEPPPAEIWVRSDLPHGRGFSSSAAFTLGLMDSLTRLSGRPLSIRALAALAYQAERNQLGIQCGMLDPAACAAGQPLFIKWIPSAIRDMDMSSQRIHPLGTLHLVVGAFQKPRDTRKILQTLQTNMNSPIQDPKGDAVREAITVFAAMAERGAYAMQNGHVTDLGACMDTAQEAYEEHLSTQFSSTRAPKLVRTCRSLKQMNALGAKFSGAGGDGSVVALFADENTARSAAIQLEEDDIFSWYVPVEAP